MLYILGSSSGSSNQPITLLWPRSHKLEHVMKGKKAVLGSFAVVRALPCIIKGSLVRFLVKGMYMVQDWSWSGLVCVGRQPMDVSHTLMFLSLFLSLPLSLSPYFFPPFHSLLKKSMEVYPQLKIFFKKRLLVYWTETT